MGYGLLTPTDVEQLEQALREAWKRARTRLAHAFYGEGDTAERFRVLEIGVCHGDTSRGIRDYLESFGGFYDEDEKEHPFPLDFWCVDNQRDRPIEPPFPGAHLVLGPSEEVYPQVPGVFDFVLVDGCHCANHVALDFLHYGDKVRPGGFLMFHDMSPRAQGKLDWQGHGPKEHPDFGTASREAARLLGLLDNRRTDWRKAWEVWDDQDWGGVLVVERVA